jgi:energy-coupling factor transporter ATP-binding protein EcfA2
MSEDPLQLPFAHLNLRRNPFGEVPVDVRPQLAVAEVDEWIDQVQDETVVEFVGESGRGKSTHMRLLAHRMPEAAYVHIHENQPPPEMPDRPVLCVDEAQFLPARRRRDLYRSDANLAIGTHVSLAGEIEAAGRTVETVSLGGRAVDAHFVRQVMEKRIDWARRDEGTVPELSDDAIVWLRGRYEDNLRAMEHHLYEVFQNLDTVRRVHPEDLETAKTPPKTIVETRQPRVREPIGAALWRTIRRALPSFFEKLS